MNTKTSLTLLAVCGALALAAGCGKNDGASPPAGNAPTPADAAAAQSQKAAEAQQKADADRAAQAAQAAEAQKLATAAKAAEAAKIAEAAKAEVLKQQAAAQKLAADTLAQATAAAAQEKGRIQSLIDTAKNLAGQNKYAEALKVLGELASFKLTPEQQALVDGLKQTVQKQAAQSVTDKAASDAAKAIGDVLGGKK